MPWERARRPQQKEERRKAIMDAAAWASELEDAMAALPAGSDPEAVAKTIAATMADRPRLSTLIALLSSVLERNVSEDLLTTFKRRIMAVQARHDAESCSQ